MCHGMWPVGIVIGVVAVGGLALDRAHPPRVLARMAAVPLLSALASLLTPVGPRLFGAVLEVNGRSQYFYEWGPPDFHEFYCVVLLLLLALALVPRLRRGSVDWFTLALVGLAALWAVYSLRTVPVAACMAAPLAALALQPGLGPRPRVGRAERVVAVAVVAAALAGLALAVPHTADRPATHPAWLDRTLPSLPDGTAVLADSSTGGYLMWRYHNLDLVAHGYGDTYTDAELERNADIESVEAGWADLVRDAEVDYALVSPDTPLGYALQDLEEWTVVAGSGDLLLLAPPPGWMSAGS